MKKKNACGLDSCVVRCVVSNICIEFMKMWDSH